MKGLFFSLVVLPVLGVISTNGVASTVGGQPPLASSVSKLASAVHSSDGAAATASESPARPAVVCSERQSQAQSQDTEKLLAKYYQQSMILLDRLQKLAFASLRAAKGEKEFMGLSSEDKAKSIGSMVDKEYSEARLELTLADKNVYGNSLTYIANNLLYQSLKKTSDKKSPIAAVLSDLSKLRSQKVDQANPEVISSYDKQIDGLIQYGQALQVKEKAGDTKGIELFRKKLKSVQKELTPAAPSNAPVATEVASAAPIAPSATLRR